MRNKSSACLISGHPFCEYSLQITAPSSKSQLTMPQAPGVGVGPNVAVGVGVRVGVAVEAGVGVGVGGKPDMAMFEIAGGR